MIGTLVLQALISHRFSYKIQVEHILVHWNPPKNGDKHHKLSHIAYEQNWRKKKKKKRGCTVLGDPHKCQKKPRIYMAQ